MEMSALHNEGNVKPDAKVLEYRVEVHDGSGSWGGEGEGEGDGRRQGRRQEY